MEKALQAGGRASTVLRLTFSRIGRELGWQSTEGGEQRGEVQTQAGDRPRRNFLAVIRSLDSVRSAMGSLERIVKRKET